MTIEINDYDGIISIVNEVTYNSFVADNWELEQLKLHLINEMNSNSIIVWQTNNFGGGNWKIKITSIEDSKKSFSEFSKTIKVTNGKLYLADYTDLTMAAQFKHYKIPAIGHENQKIDIENGNYIVKIKRMFDPEEEFNENEIAFEIVFTKTKQLVGIKFEKIFWWTF
ncbi:MAG: hypothetical protein KA313_02875 [Pseudarcicella sp.]|nr:hypothetical protein [Pseudarcicella sp.]MBP6410021.1 hypothetical protein [Pseudarcicella sp.]